jgi:hypothetical protein
MKDLIFGDDLCFMKLKLPFNINVMKCHVFSFILFFFTIRKIKFNLEEIIVLGGKPWRLQHLPLKCLHKGL